MDLVWIVLTVIVLAALMGAGLVAGVAGSVVFNWIWEGFWWLVLWPSRRRHPTTTTTAWEDPYGFDAEPPSP